MTRAVSVRRDNPHWKGEGFDATDPIQWVSEGFEFGGVYFPAGTLVRQFETRHFGYTTGVIDGVSRWGRE